MKLHTDSRFDTTDSGWRARAATSRQSGMHHASKLCSGSRFYPMMDTHCLCQAR